MGMSQEAERCEVFPLMHVEAVINLEAVTLSHETDSTASISDPVRLSKSLLLTIRLSIRVHQPDLTKVMHVVSEKYFHPICIINSGTALPPEKVPFRQVAYPAEA